ncbi:hypothetical protein [Hoylesella marshii]|uniref:Uncharacterized protein n=2 Tax=Hoylesella marshii TaxID=189722 RepID=E0NTT9_9BACT|nr:hypothetical protein [Hoylesella marshii]EFM01472.1 hypothetical protein HMPREF0658_1592 [Hoylesella marshii DSM 16973 = JCM 13450]
METRKVITADNAFSKTMSQTKALKARNMSAQGNAMGKRTSQNEALETRKAIGVDNAFGKTMLQTKALEARKMSAQGIALGKKEQKR